MDVQFVRQDFEQQSLSCLIFGQAEAPGAEPSRAARG